ncbi:hypothetical protein BDZ89DRAFT_910672, partial [Hymenopellis radicata]
SAGKSSMMVFRSFNKAMEHFTFDGIPIPLKREETYVGVTFNSTPRNIFAKHYKDKAEVAQSCA